MLSYSAPKLRALRTAAGIRREELCFRTGYSLKTIAGVETGLVRPRADLLCKVAETLGCDLVDFFVEIESTVRS